MVADATGTLKRLDAMGYRYHDIEFDVTANSEYLGLAYSRIEYRPGCQLPSEYAGRYPKLFAEMMIDSINLKKPEVNG